MAGPYLKEAFMELLSKEEVLEYAKAKSSACVFRESLYIFDLAEERRIVAARAPFERLYLGDDPLSEEDEDLIQDIEHYLKSYSEEPLLVCGERGNALFLPNLMPSSSFGIVIAPEDNDVDVASLIKKMKIKEDTGAFPVKRCHLSEAQRKTVESLMALDSPRKFPREVKEALVKRVKHIADIVGCSVFVDACNEPLVDYGEFDEGMFCSFVLISLALARRLSETRGADLSLRVSKSLGITVSVEFPIFGEIEEYPLEISALRNLAMRKNIFFDCAVGEGSVYLCFAPSSKDWSYLGLKHGDDFDWNS